jgi:hypothetical protein
MSADGGNDSYRAEHVRTELARRAHELGIRVTLAGASQSVVLAGAVATPERRAEILAIVQQLLPGYAVRDDIAVQPMATPGREQLA